MIPVCILAIENDSDREFMTNLFLEYQRLIYANILKVVTDSWAVDDIMQTTLVRLIDKIDLLKKLDRPQLANYIATASRNCALNLVKYQSSHQSTPFEDYMVDDNADSRDNETEYQFFLREDMAALSKVWDELDEKTRYLLEARYILDKSPEEIASDLHIKPASIRMALTRARRRAMERMKTLVGQDEYR